MKKQIFCLALIVATSMTMTSCLDKILNKSAREAAENVDEYAEDGDDLLPSRDRDDMSSRRRHEPVVDPDEYDMSDEYVEEEDEPWMGEDNEVEKLLRTLAYRNDLEVGGMDVLDLIDEVLSSRRLRESDLAGMSSGELSILRNAIYARHGYRFNRDDLFDYFSNFSWYNPVTSNMTAAYNSMSSVERYNVDFIRRHE